MEQNRYALRFTSARLSATLTLLAAGMIQNQEAAQQARELIDSGIKAVLAGEVVQPVDEGMYFAFSYRVWRLVRKGRSGTGLVSKTDAILKYFVAMGATESVLGKIRDQVFEIPTPPSP
jgi:hypothetical protein